MTALVRQIAGLDEISGRYDAILCDIWGVLHNGMASFPDASGCLASFRRRGGVVVLITNAPRPAAVVRRQLVKLGVFAHAFDAIATSGDVTVQLIVERIDNPVLHIGPARDLSLFSAVEEAAGRRPPLVPLEDARYALCTGLRDELEGDAERLRDRTLRSCDSLNDLAMRQSGRCHSSRRRPYLLRGRIGSQIRGTRRLGHLRRQALSPGLPTSNGACRLGSRLPDRQATGVSHRGWNEDRHHRGG